MNNSVFNKNIWRREELNLVKDRINLASTKYILNFEYINNEDILIRVKNYARYLIETTSYSFATIHQELWLISVFIKYIDKKQILLGTVKREDILEFYKYKENLRDDTFNDIVIANKHFFEYLKIKDKNIHNYFYSDDLRRTEYKYKFTAIDEYIINQIFNILHKIDSNLEAMFLLLYCIGIRISDLCQIKTDSTYKTENGYFIKYYCQKLKKEVTNPIPKSLYDILHEIILDNKKEYYNDSYLFHSTKTRKVFNTNSFSQDFNFIIKKYNIKNTDGTDYIFRAHDYRHSISTDLYKANIPITSIQVALHHDSLTMSMKYIELDDNHMIEMQRKYIDSKGSVVKFDTDNEKLAEIEWIKDNINAQILPNGLCALPVKFGECPHANTCLNDCKYFRTNISFLDVHKKHLEETNILIKICRENCWEQQLNTNLAVKHNLEKIIKEIESEVVINE